MPANDINLLSTQEFDKTPLGFILRWSLTYGRYIIVCTEIIVLLAFIYRFSLDRQITDLNEEITQKQNIIQANRTFENQFRNLQNRILVLEQLTTAQDLSLESIRYLEEITPAGIVFTSLSLAEETLEIDATAINNADLAYFLQTLTGSPRFTDVNLQSVVKSNLREGGIKFQISMKLKSETVTDKQPVSYKHE